MQRKRENVSCKQTRNDPLVTIIVPVYRVEKYLEECLDSIVSQTYGNLEIILVDDASDDRSGQICDEYAMHDHRITVYHKENGGVSSARNYALDRAHGDWYVFVDSDDWIEPDMVELLLNAAVSNHVDIVSCGIIREQFNKQELLYFPECQRILRDIGEIAKGIFEEQIIAMTVWNKLYRAAFFRERGLRFPEGRNYEDAPILTEMILHCPCVLSLPECKYHYRIRMGSISNTATLKNTIDYWTMRKEQFFALRLIYPSCSPFFLSRLRDTAINIYKIMLASDHPVKVYMEYSDLRDEIKALCAEYGATFSMSASAGQKLILMVARTNIAVLYYILIVLRHLYDSLHGFHNADYGTDVYYL